MKLIQAFVFITLATRWVAAELATTLSFDDAVRASVETDGYQSKVVVTVDTNSALAIAERPVKIEELKGILSVTGLTENPPAILIRAHKKTPNATVKAVMDGLTKSSIWRLSFEAVDSEHLYSKRKSNTPSPRSQPTQGITEKTKGYSPFDNAVRASYEAAPKENACVVVMIDKDGTISIAGYPVMLSQLKNIRAVSGLPQNPPFVLVRVHEEAIERAEYKEALDTLTKAGMTDIGCFSVSAEEWGHRIRQEGNHKSTVSQRQRLSISDAPAKEVPDWQILKGDWCADIPSIGKVAVRFSPSNQSRCELYWIFRGLSLPVQKKGDVLVLGSASNEVHNLILLCGKDGLLHFQAGGLVGERYWSAYQGLVFRPISPGEFTRITDFRHKGSEYERFNREGQLQELPQYFPGWIMNVSAYLFMNDDCLLSVLTKHPSLDPETLAFIAEFLSKKQNAEWQLAIIAAHTNTPISTLNKLFERPTSPLIWHAVARNPEAGAGTYDQYLLKVKQGDKRTHWQAARDPDCPPELLVWIYNQERDALLRGDIMRHRNTPAALLKVILKELPFDETRKSLACNPALPSDLMMEVVKTNDKQTLWTAQKNPSITTQALNNVLHRLATHSEISVHDNALLDNRIPVSVVAILMREVDQRNRMMLARNTALTFDDLVKLANDPYRVVSEEARSQLKKRFPEQAKLVLPSLKNLSLLNPASNKSDELHLAVKNRDLPTIDRCGRYFAQNEALQPGYPETFGAALRIGDSQVMTALLQHFPAFPVAEAIRDDAMNRDWIDYLYDRGILEKNQFGFLEACICNAKAGLFDYLLEKGLNVNARDNNGRTLLIHALKARSLQTVESLLARGADPAIVDSQGLLAVDYAARSYLISIVRRLDTTNKYSKFVNDFSRLFPPVTNSPVLGAWSNEKDGFSYGGFSFCNDGTGLLITSVMPVPVAWRCPRPGEMELQPIERNGPDPKQQMGFQYSVSDDVLTIRDDKKSKGAEYRRVRKQTMSN